MKLPLVKRVSKQMLRLHEVGFDPVGRRCSNCRFVLAIQSHVRPERFTYKCSLVNTKVPSLGVCNEYQAEDPGPFPFYKRTQFGLEPVQPTDEALERAILRHGRFTSPGEQGI